MTRLRLGERLLRAVELGAGRLRLRPRLRFGDGLLRDPGDLWFRLVLRQRRELLVTSAGGRMLVVTIAGNMKDYAKNEAVVRTLTNSVRVN